MPLTCPLCNRVNPDEALFCCRDGAALGGARPGGPVAVGALPFVNPFIFPSGRFCRTFDELLLACEAHWDEARDLLREGLLEGFLSGLGRADLSWAARRAAAAADPDLGLDELLSRLPGDVRRPPRLTGRPAEVNVGRVARGAEHRFTLYLLNEGMGLIRGSVSCPDADWLVLGEEGASAKVFQFRSDQAVTVRVVGARLRAGFRPPEGRLVVESSGGSAVVVVRVEAPAVVRFAHGVLAGADSPRRLAEMTRAAPREAAAYFENGAVASWYAANGWTYPVQGPPASGVAALQQFYEALGLAAPPRVELERPHLRLEGEPGDALETAVVLQTTERRAVFAHATTTEPWLRIDRPILGGRTARIPVRVPHVPDRPGEVLRGRVQVTANGNQRFAVEVTLAVRAEGVRMDGDDDGEVLEAFPARRRAGRPSLVAWILVGSFFLLAAAAAMIVAAVVLTTPPDGDGTATPPTAHTPSDPPKPEPKTPKPDDSTPKKPPPDTQPPPPPPPKPPDAAELAAALTGGDADGRRSVLKQLAALGPDARPAAAALCHALKDADPALRRMAAEVLGGIGPPAREIAHKPLVDALRDSDSDVSAAAAAALAKIGSPTKADDTDLLLLLRDKAEAVRHYALTCLRDMGTDAADFAPYLRDEITDDRSPALRRLALDALLVVAPDAPGNSDVFAKAVGDADTDVRRAAVEALAKLGPANGALPGLIQALGSDDAVTAKTAGEALKAVRLNAKQVEELGDSLREGNQTLRLRVMALLLPLGADAAPAVRGVSDVLGSGPGEARRQAFALLAAMGPAARKADGALDALLNDDKFSVRLDAATTLAAVEGPDATDAIPVLLDGLRVNQLDDAEQEAERDRAVEALGRIGAPAIKPLLDALESDFVGGGPGTMKGRINAEARLAAVEALGAMGSAANTFKVMSALTTLQRIDPSDAVRDAAKDARMRIRKGGGA